MKGLLSWVWEGSSFQLTVFLTAVTDPSLAFRMTPCHECHFIGRQKIVGDMAGIYRLLVSKIKENLKIMKIKLPQEEKKK